MTPSADRRAQGVGHLYAHIPFCPAKCGYCAFVTHIGSLRLVEPYLDALTTDIGRVASLRPRAPLQTLYLGGGTPSMLTPAQVGRVIDASAHMLGFDSGAEIAIEAHPATVSPERLHGYRSAGVTRVSFGAESLQPGELRQLGRTHDTSTVGEVVQWSKAAGFASVALDLMYGLPGQTLETWRRTLAGAIDLGVDHLSLYPLSIEPGTPFARRHREHSLSVPSDDDVVPMYHLACAMLADAGYEHYEVASWARPGHRCRHNLAYWRNREFYGVGVGAHAYVHPWRTENVRRTRTYIDLLHAGSSPVEHAESIDRRTWIFETLMLRLRLLREGLDTREAETLLGIDVLRVFAPDLAELSSRGLLEVDGIVMRIPERAVPVANEIWQRFILPGDVAA